MKLEVGMYVRFKKDKVTYIRKLLEVIHNFETYDVYRTDKEYFDYEEKDYFDIVYPENIISKPSYNIIDLIEEGDYVNGLPVERVAGTRYNNKDLMVYLSVGTLGKDENDERPYDLLFRSIRPKDIKTIVTKEQFEREKYVVGDD